MPRRFIKLKSFEIDYDKNITNVVWHEWDGAYFCAECALSPKKGEVNGTFWNSPQEVKAAINEKYYGNNI